MLCVKPPHQQLEFLFNDMVKGFDVQIFCDNFESVSILLACDIYAKLIASKTNLIEKFK